jgi:hypothetical protein
MRQLPILAYYMILIYSIAIPKLRSFSINKENRAVFTSRTKRQKGKLASRNLD